MTNKAPSESKRHHENTEPGRQMAKACFFLLIQNCMTLSRQFSHETAAFYTGQCTCHRFVATFK